MVTIKRRDRREVWREKRKVRIFGKGKCKLIANFSATMVTSLLSVSLSLSLSLSLCNIGSAEALPILCLRYFRWERERETERDRERERERERERDGSDVTIVALKLAMNSHFPLPKIRNWRWAYTFPYQKFALLVSPFTLPASPFTERLPLWRWKSQWVHTFHCQFFFRPLCSPLSNGTSRATSDRKPKTNDQILPSPILFFPSKKMDQINTKNYWK